MEQRALAREAESVPFFQRALELDPSFAIAHGRLGTVYSNLGRPTLAREHHAKAFKLRERVSQPERFYITTWYYTSVTGEIDKAIAEHEMWRQVYPRALTPWNNASGLHRAIGELDKALELALEALRLQPDQWFAYDALGRAYLYLNRFEEAKSIHERQIANDLGFLGARLHLFRIAFVSGDTAAMDEQVAWAEGRPDEFRMFHLRALAARFGGRYREARKLNRQAIDLARQRKSMEIATLYLATGAWFAARQGGIEDEEVRRKAEEALALSANTWTQFTAASALAIAGDTRRAQALADDLALRNPKRTLLIERNLPAVYAEIEIQNGNPARALELLKPALRFEPTGQVAIYRRGLAYLALKQGEQAAAEFRKILDHRGVDPLSLRYPLAQLGVARAYAMMDEAEKSRRAYQNFLELWKDADPDIPILLEARAEHAKLTE